MANHLLELFVFRETPLRAAEWGVGASLLTSSARAIHFIFFLLALMYLDHLGHNGKGTRIIIGVAVDFRFLLSVSPFRPWSFCWWLGYPFLFHPVGTSNRGTPVCCQGGLRTSYSPEARIAPVNIKLPRRVFNLTTFPLSVSHHLRHTQARAMYWSESDLFKLDSRPQIH